MYEEETVFILGAGASWHYGYPTGEALVERVRTKATDVYNKVKCPAPVDWLSDAPGYLYHLNSTNIDQAINALRSQCMKLNQTLKQVNPLVIDYFLHEHPTLQDIGKLIISLVLLDDEREYVRNDGNINNKRLLEASKYREDYNKRDSIIIQNCDDDWVRYIINNLVRGCDGKKKLTDNKVTFITYNYDVSLENRLYRGLISNELIEDEVKTKFFENEDLVLHVYGSIRARPFEDSQFGKFKIMDSPDSIRECLDIAWGSAQQIYTIPDLKNRNKEIQDKAKQIIKSAARVYLLGYGFDETNSDLIGLNQVGTKHQEGRTRPRKVYFTNFKNLNRINKAADRLLFRKEGLFTEKNVHSDGTDRHYEKSTNNVYDALAYDFD